MQRAASLAGVELMAATGFEIGRAVAHTLAGQFSAMASSALALAWLALA